MRVLVACEESQAVTTELRLLGVEAYSCDIIECSGGHPEWHIQQDVIPLINGNCSFLTCDGTEHRIDGRWDMLIAFPPCTYLTVTGNRWFNVERYGDSAVQRIREREREQLSSLWHSQMPIATRLLLKTLSELCQPNGANLSKSYSHTNTVILRGKQPVYGSKIYRSYSLPALLSLMSIITRLRMVVSRVTADGAVNVKKRIERNIVLRPFPESLKRWLLSGSRTPRYAPLGSMSC